MRAETRTSFQHLLDVLDDLEQASIAYRLEHVRNSIMVIATIPGERWEIEFFEDGPVEVERFFSSGKIEGEEALRHLTGELAVEKPAGT